MPGVYRYIFVFLIGLISCKKDRDKNPPVVRIDKPLQNSTVQAGTLLRVTGFVSDDKKLESVTIKVLSIDGHTQIADPVTVPVTSNEMSIDRTLSIGDIHTLQGTYQVILEAYDGYHREKEYVDIIVNEIPRVFRKLVIVRKSGTGYTLDSLAGGSFNTFLSRPEDFSAAAISNYHQLLYVAARKNGNLQASNLGPAAVGWSLSADIPATCNPLFFTSTYDVTSRVLWQSMAGSSFNTLRSISVSGSIQKTMIMQPGHYAASLLVNGDQMVVGENPQATGGSSLLSYYSIGGLGLLSSTIMPFKAVKIFRLSDHELVIFGNNGSQGEMRVYDKNTNGFWEQVNIPVGKIYDAVQLNSNDYLVSHSTGLIRFEHDHSNMITVGPGHQVQVLQLDTYNGALYGAEGNQLKMFNPFTGTEMSSVTAADSIRAILLHYNK